MGTTRPRLSTLLHGLFARMSQRLTMLCIVLAALALSGCATTSEPELSVDYDRAVNFRNYETFAWHPITAVAVNGNGNMSAMRERRLKAEVEAHLTAAGYKKVPVAQDADMIIKVTLGIRQDIDIDTHSVYTPDTLVVAHQSRRVRSNYTVMRGTYSGNKVSWQTVEQYTHGSISFDVYDNEKMLPVWSGVISDEIDTDLMPEENRQKAKLALIKLINQFPPQ